MRPPEELYTVHSEPSSADRPVLVYAFAGFVDAGAGVRLAAEHLLAVCDSVSMKDFERQLWQAGWSFKTLAFKRSCNVVELVPPRPSNRLPPVLMQLRRLSRASSPSAPGLAP